MDVTFRRLVDDDLPMLHRWLNEPGVVRWWEGDDVSWDAVVREYGTANPDPTEHWIASTSGRDIGWIQCWAVAGEEEETAQWWALGVERSGAGIDYLIGEPGDRHCGLGTAMVKAFVTDVVFGLHPDWTQACAAPYAANEASWRALAGAGFRFAGIVDDDDGPCRLMVADRTDDAGAAEARIAALVRDGYDLIADRYTAMAAAVDASNPRHERVAALLALLDPCSTVLEIGCGGGLPVAAAVVGAGHSLVGVDVSARQIELARSNVPAGQFVVGDVNDQELEAASFDAVMMLYVITHVPRGRWATTFRDVHHWLAPGGLLLLNVPPGGSPGWLEDDFLGMGGTSWTNAFDAATTASMLEQAGFTVVDQRQIREGGVLPETWHWILARSGMGRS